MRALYQRRQGRDLFDLWWAKEHAPVDLAKVASEMSRYFRAEGLTPPSSAELHANLEEKAQAGVFEGVRPLLRADVDYDAAAARAWFEETFLPLLD
jgi:predicted nucleotidyltransferase component of viral defense system